jgi:hypothetical protein
VLDNSNWDKESNGDWRTRKRCTKETPYCEVAAAAFVCPALDAQHRHPACHGEYCRDDAAHLAHGGRSGIGVDAL